MSDLDDLVADAPKAWLELATLRGLVGNAEIVAAWMAAELSEGQAMRAMGVDRLRAREIRDRVIASGIERFGIVQLTGGAGHEEKTEAQKS